MPSEGFVSLTRQITYWSPKETWAVYFALVRGRGIVARQTRAPWDADWQVRSSPATAHGGFLLALSDSDSRRGDMYTKISLKVEKTRS